MLEFDQLFDSLIGDKLCRKEEGEGGRLTPSIFCWEQLCAAHVTWACAVSGCWLG